MTALPGSRPRSWAALPALTASSARPLLFSYQKGVPAGTSALNLSFEHLAPVGPASGRVIVTREMVNVQWNSVLLYPAGRPAAESGRISRMPACRRARSTRSSWSAA